MMFNVLWLIFKPKSCTMITTNTKIAKMVEVIDIAFFLNLNISNNYTNKINNPCNNCQ